jgi:opacity protein-like surface antigen
MMRRFVLVVPVLLALAALLPAGEAFAQGTTGVGWKGWGVRVGGSVDPDQVYGGVHFNLGEFAKDVRFRPTIEMGFGDDVTTIQALAEVHYVFSKVQVWKPYVGGGLGFNYVHANNDCDNCDDSDTEVSFAAMGGVETKLKSGTGLFFEGKIGFGDNDADFKACVGWNF